MFSGGEIRFEKGQRIVSATATYFELLGEVEEVQGEGEESLVKVQWGRGNKAKEEWVKASDLRARLFDNRRNYWKLFEEEQRSWGEKRDVEVKREPILTPQEIVGRIEAAQEKLEIILDPEKQRRFLLEEQLKALRETKDILQKDLADWSHLEKEKAENRFSTFALGLYYWATQGDFLHDGTAVDLEELQDRHQLLSLVDQKIKLYEQAQAKGLPTFDELFSLEFDYFKKAHSEKGIVRTYAGLQSLYLNHHPEVLQSPFLQRLNEMIARDVLETPLLGVVTSDDLERVEKDIETYNLELAKEKSVGGGSKLAKGYGLIDVREIGKEMGRLIKLERDSKTFETMHRNKARIDEAAGELRESPAPASARVGFAIAQGALEMIDEPSLAMMLVAGAGIAGPLSRSLMARLVASGVPLSRARTLALAFNGMLFSTSKSAMEFGLDQLPGVDRSAHVDFTPEGMLHAIAMMGWLSQMQKVYGQTMQGYLKFLRERPVLQKTLDVLGSKTFETLGLASFNLGIGTAHHGLETLSPDNIYRELLDSARFTIAYGAMHAGGHVKKSPAREAFALAQQNLFAELRRQMRVGEYNKPKMHEKSDIARRAFEALHREQQEGFEKAIRLGRMEPRDVVTLLARQRRLIQKGIGQVNAASEKNTNSWERSYLQYTRLQLLEQDRVVDILLQEAKRHASRAPEKFLDEIESRSARLEPGERPERAFEKAASRKKMPRSSRVGKHQSKPAITVGNPHAKVTPMEVPTFRLEGVTVSDGEFVSSGQTEVTIGRADDNDFVPIVGELEQSRDKVSRPLLSRHHGKIIYRDGRFFVVPTSRWAEIWVNGDRIRGEKEISEGDAIRFGVGPSLPEYFFRRI